MNSSRVSNRRCGLSRRGFTLIEVLVAAGMLLGIAVSWGSFVRNVNARSKKGRFDVHLAKEHKAVLALVSSIPKHAVDLKSCVFLPALFKGEKNDVPGFHPHPYRYVDPANGQCAFRGNPLKDDGANKSTPAPEFVINTLDFYNKLWEWPTVGAARYNGNLLNTKLDFNYADQVAQSAKNAGCTTCHDGQGGASKNPGTKNQVPDWIRNCNFGEANDWRTMCDGQLNGGNALLNAPIASRNMLASRAGQLFLPDEGAATTNKAWTFMNRYLQNFLLNRQTGGALGQGFLSYGTQVNSFVRFLSPAVTTFGGTVCYRGPLEQPNCVCSGPGTLCGCAPGETLDVGSCTTVCTGINSDTGQCTCPGKDCWQPCPPQCTGTTTRYRCQTTGLCTTNVPQISVSTGALNPDPATLGAVASQQTLSSAVVPK